MFLKHNITSTGRTERQTHGWKLLLYGVTVIVSSVTAWLFFIGPQWYFGLAFAAIAVKNIICTVEQYALYRRHDEGAA